MQELFGDGFVLSLDSLTTDEQLAAHLEDLWNTREDLLNAAYVRRDARAHLWTWESRVHELLRLMDVAN